MSIFKAIVKTVVEVPLATARDIFTLGGSATNGRSKLKETYEDILDELD